MTTLYLRSPSKTGIEYMHELGIAVQVVESAVSSIPSSLQGQPVKKVTLDIGKMAGITAHSLRFCFEIVSKGTVLETSELVINEIPVTAKCRSCLSEWIITEPIFLCEKCGTPDINVETGRELLIRSIEVADNQNI
jgi:hydrogenase nickel incorporation protein HypA/HybF